MVQGEPAASPPDPGLDGLVNHVQRPEHFFGQVVTANTRNLSQRSSKRHENQQFSRQSLASFTPLSSQLLCKMQNSGLIQQWKQYNIAFTAFWVIIIAMLVYYGKEISCYFS